MYLGRRFRPKGNDDRIFNSGGAAYVLNQASLGLLAAHLDDPACHAHQRCSWEDVNVRRACGVLVCGAVPAGMISVGAEAVVLYDALLSCRSG